LSKRHAAQASRSGVKLLRRSSTASPDMSRLLLPFAATLMLLAACGQTGSLKLPNRKPASRPTTPTQPVAPPASAAAPAADPAHDPNAPKKDGIAPQP
jgi:hypothetical protein